MTEVEVTNWDNFKANLKKFDQKLLILERPILIGLAATGAVICAAGAVFYGMAVLG